MVVEQLKFAVKSEHQAKFIQKDGEIWTNALSKYPAFVNKQVWINPDVPEEIMIVVWWRSLTEWHSIPKAELDVIQQEFDQAMGQDYSFVSFTTYNVIETQA